MKTIFRYRYLFLTLLIIAAVYLSKFLPSAMTPNNGLELWFVEDDPHLKAYRASLDQFGNDEVILVLFKPPEPILSRENIERVRKICREIENMEDISEVYSITNVQDIRTEGDTLIVEDLIPGSELTDEQKSVILDKLKNDPLIGREYVDKEASSILILVRLKVLDDIDMIRDKINLGVIEILDANLKQKGIEYAAGGTGLNYTELNLMTTRDVNIFGYTAYLLMFILVTVFLRSFWALLIALLVVTLTLLITMGLFGFFGYQINMLTIILPTLLIILSIGDVVHLITHYRGRLSERTVNRKVITRALSYISIPCFFTSVTTFFGFGSLCSARMEVVRQLGIFAAIGVMVAFFVTFILASVILPRVRLSPVEKNSVVDRFISTITHRIGILVTEHTKKVIAVFLVIMAALALTFPMITVDIHTYEYFPPDSRVVKDHKRITREYGDYLPLEVAIKAKEAEGFTNPAMLRKLRDFQQQVESLPLIADSRSVADVLYKVHQTMTDEDALPDTRQGVAQELLLYDMSDPEGLEPLVNGDRDYVHLFFKFDFVSGNETRKLIDEILALGQQTFGTSAVVEPVGYLPLYIKLVDYALQTQIMSFSIAFVTIFLFILILVRSLKYTLLSILPNLLPVCVTGGILALWHIDLDFGTASIAAILLGIVVDDTIHLIYAIKQKLLETPTETKEAIRGAISDCGYALISTTMVLFFGFLIMLLAEARTVIYFGALISFSVLAALFSDLLFLPALIYLFSKKDGGKPRSNRSRPLS